MIRKIQITKPSGALVGVQVFDGDDEEALDAAVAAYHKKHPKDRLTVLEDPVPERPGPGPRR